MSKTILNVENPVTQSIAAIKALLSWRGRAVDPLPSKIEFMNHGDESRLMLILSNDKAGYYVVTQEACSCPSATYSPGRRCKHQRRYFPQETTQPTATASESIRPAGKWAGGYNGPVEA